MYPSTGGAKGPDPKSDPGVVPAPGGLPEPAKLPEGLGQKALQAQGHERRQPVPPGVRQTAAAAQRQREGAGGLVRAPPHGPAEEKADRGGGLEKEQGADGGLEGQAGAPERGHTETGGAESLSGAEDQSDGEGEGGEEHTAQGTVTEVK